MRFLITGSSGFIGFHLANKLLNDGHNVLGIDCHTKDDGFENKNKRLKILRKFKKFRFIKLDLSNNFSKKKLKNLDFLIHLAAQPGVRISLEKPIDCIKNNVLSFVEVIEFVKNNKVKNFLYASSSTVYGERNKGFKETEITKRPKSLYAISKIDNEMTARFYNENFGINSIGIRFFSIYGNFGRKDMSYYKFLEDIFKKKKIFIYGNGSIKRSFTHIDDTITCLIKLINKFKTKKKYFEIFNIGNEETISINKIVSLIKNISQKSFKIVNKKKFNVDNKLTKTNNDKIYKSINFKPRKKILVGLKEFIEWYKKDNR